MIEPADEPTFGTMEAEVLFRTMAALLPPHVQMFVTYSTPYGPEADDATVYASFSTMPPDHAQAVLRVLAARIEAGVNKVTVLPKGPTQ